MKPIHIFPHPDELDNLPLLFLSRPLQGELNEQSGYLGIPISVLDEFLNLCHAGSLDFTGFSVRGDLDVVDGHS